LQGGTVSAESPGEGQGATFTVKLPPLVIPSANGSIASTSHCLLKSAANPLDPSLLKGVTVLVVDDENDARELLQTILEQSGASVTAVASVAEAIAAYEAIQPDILISDIAMPGEDGYALIHKVKTLEDYQAKPMPAIALTAYAREEDQDQALSEGFQMHFAKPVEPNSLVGALVNLLGRHVAHWVNSPTSCNQFEASRKPIETEGRDRSENAKLLDGLCSENYSLDSSSLCIYLWL